MLGADAYCPLRSSIASSAATSPATSPLDSCHGAEASARQLQSDSAAELAAALGLTSRWTSSPPASEYFAYFGDGESLAVIVASQETSRDVDKALAYGLSYAGDRDLLLVLPKAQTWPTLARAAFLDVPVQVFEYDDVGIAPLVIPAEREVFERLRGGIRTGVHDLGEQQSWVEELLQWTGGQVELSRADRNGCLTWHCRGRQVLKVRRADAGFKIEAGVVSTGAAARHAPALTIDLEGAP